MSNGSVHDPGNGEHRACRALPGRAGAGARWSFVYIFFTNHIPFDAPNRSEPCSLR